MKGSVWREVQEQRGRFMQDPVAVRLGNLASTLARAAACAGHPARRDLVYRLLTEAQYFIDCTGPEADPAIQPELVDLQLQLARLRRRWQADPDPGAASELARQSRQYSQQVLEWSGLLE